MLCDREPLRVTEGVAPCVLVPLSEGVRDVEGVRATDPVAVPERVLVPLRDVVCVPVRVLELVRVPVIDAVCVLDPDGDLLEDSLVVSDCD